MFIGHFGLALRRRNGGAVGLARHAVSRLSVRRLVVADAGPARHRARRGRAGRDRDDAARLRQLSVLAQPARACVWGVRSAASTTRQARADFRRVTLALLVVSHWVLDYVTHRPDMPLTLGGPPRLGLGLGSPCPARSPWSSRSSAPGWVYARATAARDRIGSIGLWALVGFLLVRLSAAAFGPPPPSATPSPGPPRRCGCSSRGATGWISPEPEN